VSEEEEAEADDIASTSDWRRNTFPESPSPLSFTTLVVLQSG
jgi:hypothetical protein